MRNGMSRLEFPDTGNHKMFIGVIPSFPAEHQQVHHRTERNQDTNSLTQEKDGGKK